jgi:putative redox protein
VVQIQIKYEGGLHCSATHGPSSATLQTDAPVDNHGRGESFSPTDLVATALGTCMVTIMGILADRKRWRLDGTEVHVCKEMTSAPPRRIERLAVRFDVPDAVAAALDEGARKQLDQAARSCPVRLSILPAIEVPIEFRWGSA